MFDDFVFFRTLTFGAFVQALFEIVYRAAQIFADVAQFFSAEHQNYDNQNDDPVCYREATQCSFLYFVYLLYLPY